MSTTSVIQIRPRSGIWHQVCVLLTSYPDVLIATLGLGLMCLAGVISIRAVRSRLRRETWWTVHLVMYLALALSFAHVLTGGWGVHATAHRPALSLRTSPDR